MEAPRVIRVTQDHKVTPSGITCSSRGVKLHLVLSLRRKRCTGQFPGWVRGSSLFMPDLKGGSFTFNM